MEFIDHLGKIESLITISSSINKHGIHLGLFKFLRTLPDGKIKTAENSHLHTNNKTTNENLPKPPLNSGN